MFFGSRDEHLYAVDITTGQERWKFDTRGPVDSSPAIAEGVVFFASMDGILYAVDLDTGIERWMFDIGFEISANSPAIARGVLYFASRVPGVLFVVNLHTGEEGWRFHTANEVLSAPAVADGVVFLGAADGNLYALR